MTKSIHLRARAGWHLTAKGRSILQRIYDGLPSEVDEEEFLRLLLELDSAPLTSTFSPLAEREGREHLWFTRAPRPLLRWLASLKPLRMKLACFHPPALPKKHIVDG